MPSAVSIVRGNDPVAMVAEAIELLGGMQAFVSPGDTVLVKPNSFVKQVPANGNVARPEVAIAVAQLARDAGAGRVVIGERNKAAVVANFADTGVEKVAELLPFEDDEHVTVTIPNARALLMPVTVPRILLDCDRHITVPVGKTHCGAGVTACLKNAMGLMMGAETQKSHAFGVCKVPIDMNTLKWPVLGVVDMTIAQEGNFPGAGGTPVPMDLIVAAADIVAADATCCRLMGYEPRDVWMVHSAAERGLGEIDQDAIEIRGEQIANARKSLTGVVFDPTEFGSKVDWQVDLRCRYCVQDAVSFLRTDDGRRLLETLASVRVVAGPVRDIPEDDTPTLVVGNCNAWLMDRGAFAHGCPPAVWQIAAPAGRLLEG